MKFLYQYRTADNVPHSGVITAPDREAVYTQLRKKGIRPGVVTEAPGFFNALFGKGKRWIAIAILAVTTVAAVVSVIRLKSDVRRLSYEPEVLARGQVYGDPSVLQICEDALWRNVFSNRGDQVLALFARPGDETALRMPRVSEANVLDEALATAIEFDEHDGVEIGRMKRIVNGMKTELRRYIANGGTAAGYLDRLYERQEQERRIRDSRVREIETLKRDATLDREAFLGKWEIVNDGLREFGIKPIDLPPDFYVKKNEMTP